MSFLDVHRDQLHIWGLGNGAARSMNMQVALWSADLDSSGDILSRGMDGPDCIRFLRNLHSVCIAVTAFSSAGELLFPASSVGFFFVLCILAESHSDRSEMGSSCSFDLYFPDS